MVNVCAEEHTGDGLKWQPAHEAKHVKKIQVMLCNGGASADHMEDETEEFFDCSECWSWRTAVLCSCTELGLGFSRPAYATCISVDHSPEMQHVD